MHGNLERSAHDHGELARFDTRDLPRPDAVEARDGNPLAFRRYPADAGVSVTSTSTPPPSAARAPWPPGRIAAGCGLFVPRPTMAPATREAS